jgi:hypothetical protein
LTGRRKSVARRKKTAPQAFVLLRFGWAECEEGPCFECVKTEDADPRLGWPLAVFTDRQAAEARKEQLEREERSALNPFAFVGPTEYDLQNVSSLSVEQFAARLKELAPKARLPRLRRYGHRDWVVWWARHADTLTEDQRQSVWGLLDRLEFYRVLPTEME